MTTAYSYFSDSKQQAGNNDCVQHLENAHRRYMCTSESDILRVRSSSIFLICGRLEKILSEERNERFDELPRTVLVF